MMVAETNQPYLQHKAVVFGGDAPRVPRTLVKFFVLGCFCVLAFDVLDNGVGVGWGGGN